MNATTLTDEEMRVELGAVALDNYLPTWHRKVDVDQIEHFKFSSTLNSLWWDVLSQVFVSHAEGIYRLTGRWPEWRNSAWDWSVEHGFMFRSKVYPFADDPEEMGRLRSAWIEAVLERRANESAMRSVG